MVGCAELARLSASVAEVRSLVVDESLRGQQIGTRLVAHLASSGAAAGYSTLCAFTHAPGHFVRLGLHHRAAHLDAREDRARLQRLRAVPPLRPVRRCG